MMLHHLHGGVNKGAFSAEEADKRFAQWMEDKSQKIQTKKDSLAASKAESLAEKLKAEAKVKEAKAAAIAAKNTPVVEEVATEETPANEEEVATEETPVAENPAPEAEAENNTEA